MKMVRHEHPAEQGGGFGRGTRFERAAGGTCQVEVGKQGATCRCRERHEIDATGLRVAPFAQGTMAGWARHAAKHPITKRVRATGYNRTFLQDDSDNPGRGAARRSPAGRLLRRSAPARDRREQTLHARRRNRKSRRCAPAGSCNCWVNGSSQLTPRACADSSTGRCG